MTFLTEQINAVTCSIVRLLLILQAVLNADRRTMLNKLNKIPCKQYSSRVLQIILSKNINTTQTSLKEYGRI